MRLLRTDAWIHTCRAHIKSHVRLLSRVPLFATPWAVARQAPLSVGFPRQEYWSGLPFSSPGDLPDPGIEPVSLVSPALAGGFFTISIHTRSHILCVCVLFFLLEYDCFTMLCYFLLYNEMNHPYVYMCLLPLAPPSHSPPHPSRSSEH